MSKRALSVNHVMEYRPRTFAFEGLWRQSLGTPERKGAVLIWGESGNGKTRFALQLCKYLATFDRLLYNSLEEGLSKTIQDAYRALDMHQVNGSLLLLDKEPVAELRERLRLKNAPQIVAIDSVQYSGLSYDEYLGLRAEFPRVFWVLISHADGKLPAGAVAKSIMYNADIKVHVVGYRAFVRSRFGGERPYDVWPEEAERIHGPIE